MQQNSIWVNPIYIDKHVKVSKASLVFVFMLTQPKLDSLKHNQVLDQNVLHPKSIYL